MSLLSELLLEDVALLDDVEIKQIEDELKNDNVWNSVRIDMLRKNLMSILVCVTVEQLKRAGAGCERYMEIKH